MSNENPTRSRPREPPFKPHEWDEKDTLPDGANVARLGALWYVCDSRWKAISKGYHEIRVADYGYVGKLGARKETFRPLPRGEGGPSNAVDCSSEVTEADPQ